MTGSRESIRITGIISAFVAGIILTGCVSPSYYIHVSYHHLKLIHDRKSVKVLINDPVIPQELKVKLSLTQEIRSFASTRLLLPDNDSYTTYTDLKQPYLMWNVVAAPELSLEPVRWDFLFAGTLSYRGFYTLEKAKAFADKLIKKGYDVYIGNVPAYSTLGWFYDPVLSSFIEWPESDIAALIFHELAHQKLYIKGDTQFNESFAEMVAQEGVSRWFSTRNDPEALNRYLKNEAQHRIVMNLLMDTAEDLRNLYEEPIPDEQKRIGKKTQFSSLRSRFQSLKEKDPSFSRFERWIFRDLNNARFSLLSIYHGYIPSFRALLTECHGDLDRFYEQASRIGSLADKERKDALARLVRGNEQDRTSD